MRTLAVTAALLMAAITQTAAGSKVEVSNYRARFTNEGRVEVRLTNPRETHTAKVLSVYAPRVAAVQDLVRAQDWYLKIGSDGHARGLYTVPRGSALSSNVVRGLAEGQSLIKVAPYSSFLKVFPDASEMSDQVADFARSTRAAVCTLDARPESVRARVDVKPGWSATGTIRIDATWNTTTLCEAPKKLVRPVKATK